MHPPGLQRLVQALGGRVVAAEACQLCVLLAAPSGTVASSAATASSDSRAKVPRTLATGEGAWLCSYAMSGGEGGGGCSGLWHVRGSGFSLDPAWSGPPLCPHPPGSRPTNSPESNTCCPRDPAWLTPHPTPCALGILPG